MKKTSILTSLIFLAFVTASIIVFNYYSLIHNQSNHTGLELMKVKKFYFIISTITFVLAYATRSNKKSQIIFIISGILGLVFVTNIWMFEKMEIMLNYQDWRKLQIKPKEVETTEIKNEPIPFVTELLKKIPNTYIVSEVEYLETFDSDPQKAIEVKPCNEKTFDPTYSPLCYTKLTIVEQAKTDSLEEFIKANNINTSDDNPFSSKIKIGTYKENIPFFYTQNSFVCIGTGAESCMRKRFLYHLDDGRNILVELSFWPYKNGLYVGEISKEVSDVIKLYEDILTK